MASPRSEAGLNKPKNPQQEGQDEDDDLSDALEEVPVTKSKADARREYEAGVIRQKKAAREEAALLKSGKGKKQTDALKQHPEELQRRIEAVRR